MSRVNLKKEDAIEEAYRKIAELQGLVQKLGGNRTTIPVTNLTGAITDTQTWPHGLLTAGPGDRDGAIWVEQSDGSLRWRVNGVTRAITGSSV